MTCVGWGLCHVRGHRAQRWGDSGRPDWGPLWPPVPPRSSVAAFGLDWRSHDWATGRALVPFSIVGPAWGVVQGLTPRGSPVCGPGAGEPASCGDPRK